MSSDTGTKSNFRGVLCHHCGKPVRVPSLVARQESACQGHLDSDDTTFHLISRVFVLRCRTCEKESVYAINQIVDCVPPPASSNFKQKTATA
jgi:NMD protein affecting ribosome stability and mRNA decay